MPLTDSSNRVKRFCSPAFVLVLLGLGVFGLHTGEQTAVASPDETAERTPKHRPPVPTLNGNVPLTVKVPSSVSTPEQARPFFDAFSWQSFIALNWPASGSHRGQPEQPDDPDVFLSQPHGAHPVVWGAYKEEFELFDQGANRPTPWESVEIPVNPCGDEDPRRRVFVRHSKGDSLVEESNQAFSFPLIDQSRQYAVYEVRFNEAQYNFVRGKDEQPSTWLYLARNLAPKEPISMPASHPPSTQGALMIKAAWKILDPERDDPSRFYHMEAWVLDPQSQDCKPHRIGLIGIHIVQKLQAFPQWIWSSFEQVDNVPAGPHEEGPHDEGYGDAGRGYSFNNGTNDPPTVGGWANRPFAKAPHLQPIEERTPVQVTRFNPIPRSTQALNRHVRDGILQDTVWRHYQLVITQWPSTPHVFKTMEVGGIYPRDSGGAFPVNGATNSVMETYFQSPADAQGAGGNSCMSCHYLAAQADYSWTLLRGAH